ncbi:hypothetical protein T492DRAFT_939025 [Pavlovales sp. CCMP2436]|nr:hypothetical protein T492DRAFT_939025 [Pavlovales sp. CCMP2436]|mmetsp:Transcript_519/g.1430  ORF Transcript_519/g.1430 Transcript_519/m.1430 type:complete len:194 (-) Transcript_519:289-870(-)
MLLRGVGASRSAASLGVASGLIGRLRDASMRSGASRDFAEQREKYRALQVFAGLAAAGIAAQLAFLVCPDESFERIMRWFQGHLGEYVTDPAFHVLLGVSHSHLPSSAEPDAAPFANAFAAQTPPPPRERGLEAESRARAELVASKARAKAGCPAWLAWSRGEHCAELQLDVRRQRLAFEALRHEWEASGSGS